MHNWLLNGCVESITRTLNAIPTKHASEQIAVIVFMTLKTRNKEVKISLDSEAHSQARRTLDSFTRNV